MGVEKDNKLMKEFTKQYYWVETSAIQSRINHITMSCIGDQITLAVNGITLVEAHDNTWTNGKIGLIGFAADSPPVTVAFDNFSAIAVP